MRRAHLLNTLSGRFLLLTTLFVLLAEVFILLPAVSGYREDYLKLRLERAQIASLALLASDDSISESLERELLANAGVFNVVLLRDDMRQLVLSSPIPGQVGATYDLRDDSFFSHIRGAVSDLSNPQNHIIRVIGQPVQDAGQQIEVTMESGPMRKEMLEYGLRILTLSAVFSVTTAILLFLLVRRLIVTPIRRVVGHMKSYAAAPEDARNVIEPNARVIELREAEDALQSLQTQMTGALRQKERLASLGEAVAKVSHDLRNILTTAQLFADRMESSEDPAVKRAAPKLVNSISRAVNLCESTLAFGKAQEPPPRLGRFMLRSLIDDILENEQPAAEAGAVEFVTDVPASLMIRGDSEQLYRVLANLIRNARQAIEATNSPGTIEVAAGEDDNSWWIRVGDTGPGLPERAQENLFRAFQGGYRKGGTGLGLAISAELVRGHGGRLELLRTSEDGTEFLIRLPKDLVPADVAA